MKSKGAVTRLVLTTSSLCTAQKRYARGEVGYFVVETKVASYRLCGTSDYVFLVHCNILKINIEPGLSHK